MWFFDKGKGLPDGWGLACEGEGPAKGEGTASIVLGWAAEGEGAPGGGWGLHAKEEGAPGGGWGMAAKEEEVCQTTGFKACRVICHYKTDLTVIQQHSLLLLTLSHTPRLLPVCLVHTQDSLQVWYLHPGICL